MNKRTKKGLILLLGMILAILIFPSHSPAAKEPTTLRVALASFGNEQLDPIKVGRGEGNQYLGQLYDLLAGVSPDGKLAPGIATDWQMAADGLSWVFHLRKGAQFHDGWGEVTAEDVKFSLERFISPASESNNSAYFKKIIKDLEIVDKYTVRIHTKTVIITLPLDLAPQQGLEGMILCKKYILQKAGNDPNAQTKLINSKPIGSGPYKFVERKLGDYMIFQAEKSHWRTTPGFDRIKLMLVPELATQIAMLKTGEVDLIQASAETMGDIQKAGFEVRGIPHSIIVGVQTVGYAWPTPVANNMPITKAKVREALSLAINRQEILDHLFAGKGNVPDLPWGLGPTTVDLDFPYFKKFYQEACRFDSQKAKQLLNEAGFPGGASVKMFSYNRGGSPWAPRIAEVIAGYWSNIGIKTQIVPIDYGAFRPHYIHVKPDDPFSGGCLHVFDSSARATPTSSLNLYYYSKNLAGSAIDNPELDKIINELPTLMDVAKRRELTKRAYDIVWQEKTILPLFDLDALYGINPKVVGKWQPISGFPYLGLVFEGVKPK